MFGSKPCLIQKSSLLCVGVLLFFYNERLHEIVYPREYEVANLFLEFCKVKPKLYIYIFKTYMSDENLPCLCGNNVKK